MKQIKKNEGHTKESMMHKIKNEFRNIMPIITKRKVKKGNNIKQNMMISIKKAKKNIKNLRHIIENMKTVQKRNSKSMILLTSNTLYMVGVTGIKKSHHMIIVGKKLESNAPSAMELSSSSNARDQVIVDRIKSMLFTVLLATK